MTYSRSALRPWSAQYPCVLPGRNRELRGPDSVGTYMRQRRRRERTQIQQSAATRKPNHLSSRRNRCPGSGGDIQKEVVALRIAGTPILAIQTRQHVLSVG